MLQAMSSADPESPLASAPTIDELVIADEPECWAALGFTVVGECCQLGSVCVRLAGRGAGRGIVRWSLRAIAAVELDGLPTMRSRSPVPLLAPVHPNGALAIDHVVAMSPALERSVQALGAAGLELRRIREQPTPAGAPRQAFFRLGAEVLEVVQEPDSVVERGGGRDRPARPRVLGPLEAAPGVLDGSWGGVAACAELYRAPQPSLSWCVSCSLMT